ncbi:MAG: CPBP family intramembrane metalloprotease [Bacteroidetes bacterium]|jgi:membrane protease YdiL (CAAX protease family)|nr:CPBP family intramembrane metalloprotease [Bacteroidota bacterium]
MTHSTASDTSSFSFASLVPFLVITFGLAWGIIGLYIALPDQMAAMFGALSGQHPLFYLATYSPAVAALAIVVSKARWTGTRGFLSRLLLWRAPAVWYAFLLLGIPLLFYIGAVWKGLSLAELVPVSSVGGYLVALALFAIKGPVEEIGWRGLALPLLQRKMSPLWASLVLVVIWGVWHLPAFMLSGTPQSAWSFTDFFIGTLALSFIATALFNASRGSILLPALFHLQVINPLWPDAQPYDTIPFVVAALVVVWLNRDTMLHRSGGVTTIIPSSKSREAGVSGEGVEDAAPKPRITLQEV